MVEEERKKTVSLLHVIIIIVIVIASMPKRDGFLTAPRTTRTRPGGGFPPGVRYNCE